MNALMCLALGVMGTAQKPLAMSTLIALLLFQDMFSGYVMCKAMRGTTAQEVSEAYEEVVFRRFRASSMTRHDRDPRFMSDMFRHFARMMGSQQCATLAYPRRLMVNKGGRCRR
jgi:hypothetical protein